MKIVATAKVDELLNEKGLNRSKLAELIGVFPSALTCNLNGTHAIKMATAYRIKEALETELPLEELFQVIP